MGLKLMFMLLFAADLAVLGLFGDDGESISNRWTRQTLPRLLVKHKASLDNSLFRGQREEKVEARNSTLCGIECQGSLSSVNKTEQHRILGYETLYNNGTRVHTDVSLQWMNEAPGGATSRTDLHIRRKRQVYGGDGRFVISDPNFITNYPFSTAVRISTGCSGVLVSPKHVLTAAHCIHDGWDYLQTTRNLRVGLLQLKPERRRFRQKRGRRRRGGRIQDNIDLRGGKEKTTVGGLRRGEERRRSKLRKSSDEGEAVFGKKEFERKDRKKHSLRHVQRHVAPGKQTVFQWSQIKQTQIPQGWIHTNISTDSMYLDFDYALLELKHAVKHKHMELGVAPTLPSFTRIHFSGYDTDKSLSDRSGNRYVVYRFCSVTKESDDLMYQHCDAERGAAGAGVYIRLRMKPKHKGGKWTWQRRVIGVFSGHQWVEVDRGEQRDFNVAVRITPRKYAQICHWMYDNSAFCTEV